MNRAPFARRGLAVLTAVLAVATSTACTTVQRGPSGAGVLRADVAPASTAAPHAPAARKFQKWNPAWWLANADDPVPPDWYRPGAANRRFLWHLRNPLHNFTFYVIGIADRECPRTGLHPDDVMAPRGGWNFSMSWCCGWIPLPFASYNGKHCQTYLGWRPRGNFGAKFNIGPRPEIPPAPPEPPKPPG